MKPTQEQFMQWTRDAGFFLYDLTETHGEKVIESDDKDQHAQLHRLITRAYTEGRVFQADADAQMCDSVAVNAIGLDSIEWDKACESCANSIRYNAPKEQK